MKKIMQFITNLNDGGAETLVKEYALLIDHTRFDIVIVTIRNVTNTSVYKTLKENDIRIINVYPKWNICIKIFNKLFGKKYIDYRLKRIIALEKPDVIHAHLYVLKYLNRISKHLKDIKLFYTCHSIVTCYFGTKYPEQTEAAKNLIKNNGMKFIALHDKMRVELNEMFDVDDTVVLKNGIDIHKFVDSYTYRDETRKQLGIKNDEYLVGHVGRFSYQKNHKFLLEVFRRIKDRNLKAKLLLVGSGPDKEKINNWIKELDIKNDVVILSHRTDIPQLMAAMDVFIFPSIIEGFGIVLVEAQASKLRCIVSDNVPSETYLSKYIIPLSLTESIDKWCEVAIDGNLFSQYQNRIDLYDINNEIKKLEQLYIGIKA